MGMENGLDRSERFGLMDVPLWLAFYAMMIAFAALLYPLFLVKNFIPLMRSQSFFKVGVGLIALDQLTKVFFWNYLGHPGNRVVVIPGFLDFTLVTNLGAAFGLFPGRTDVFISMALLTIAIIVAYLSMIGEEEKMVRLALVCIMAGAIGNLIDRVFLGHVIDFIDVHYGPHHWPVFNLADTVIDIGVGLILIDVVRDFVRTRDQAPAAG